MPPDRWDAFEPQNAGIYRPTSPVWRWLNGRILPVDVQTYPHAAELHSHESCKWYYRAATVFTLCPGNQHFLGVNFDARRYNVSERDPWIDIGFEHPPAPAGGNYTYSFVNSPGARPTLGARHPIQWNHWAHQLFTQQYHFNPSEVDNPHATNAGLTGTLPFIFALVTFACPRNWTSTGYVFQNHIRPRQWVPLPQGTTHGREFLSAFLLLFSFGLIRLVGVFERGVVVTVWIDPAGDPDDDEVEERQEALEELEKGNYGPFFAP